jgi:hypothetical protein
MESPSAHEKARSNSIINVHQTELEDELHQTVVDQHIDEDIDTKEELDMVEKLPEAIETSLEMSPSPNKQLESMGGMTQDEKTPQRPGIGSSYSSPSPMM